MTIPSPAPLRALENYLTVLSLRQCGKDKIE
jgi:hypothetical protein